MPTDFCSDLGLFSDSIAFSVPLDARNLVLAGTPLGAHLRSRSFKFIFSLDLDLDPDGISLHPGSTDAVADARRSSGSVNYPKWCGDVPLRAVAFSLLSQGLVER